MILVIIPILAMLGLGFILPGKTPPRMKPFLGIAFCVFSLLFGVRWFISAEWFYPHADAITHVRGQVDHLIHSPGWENKPLVILEGSSVTEFGIDQELLEKTLHEHGINATVLKFSLPGANHFERLFMLELFIKKVVQIYPHHPFEKAPVVLLSEVFQIYDQNPLDHFFKESNTLRSLIWLEPHNAFMAWKALRASSQEKKNITWIMLEHLFLNRFAVGIFSALQPLNYNKKDWGFFPLTKTKGSFCYKKSKEAFEKIILDTSPTLLKNHTPPAGWMIYYQELFAQIAPYVHTLVFYAIPTLDIEEYQYQNAFCRSLPTHTMMLGPASPRFMKKLLDEKNWFDEVHPEGPGAYELTTWLAKKITQRWSEILKTKWNVGEK